MDRVVDGPVPKLARTRGRRVLLGAGLAGATGLLIGCATETSPAAIIKSPVTSVQGQAQLESLRRTALVHNVVLRPEGDNYGANGPLKPNEALLYEPIDPYLLVTTGRRTKTGQLLILTGEQMFQSSADRPSGNLYTRTGTSLKLEALQAYKAGRMHPALVGGGLEDNKTLALKFEVANSSRTPRTEVLRGMTLYVMEAGKVHSYQFNPAT